MPVTKTERFVFGLFMSVAMAFGMEVYNIAGNTGGLGAMTNSVFVMAGRELLLMAPLVLLFSGLWGNRVGHALAARLVRPEQDSPCFITLVVTGCTVLIMCPTMSLTATIVFRLLPGALTPDQLPAAWVGTVLKNFPMALLWNIFAAGPVTRLLFRLLCRRKTQTA